MSLLKHTRTSLHQSLARAQGIVDACRRDDPDWRYEIDEIELATGGTVYSIEVFDEDGELLGYL